MRLHCEALGVFFLGGGIVLEKQQFVGSILSHETVRNVVGELGSATFRVNRVFILA